MWHHQQNPQPELLREWGTLCLRFPEPLVRLSVVEHCRRLRSARSRRELTASERRACGLDLFTLSGSPAPTLYWEEQDCLRLMPHEDGHAHQEYQLRFLPGLCYLSGAAVGDGEWRFHFPDAPLKLEADWLPSHPGGAVLIFPRAASPVAASRLVACQQMLSVHFERMRRGRSGKLRATGCCVPARLRPATLADGFGSHHSDEAFRLLMEQQAPDAIGPEPPMPHALVATPEEALEPGSHYVLHMCPAPDSGFEGGQSRAFLYADRLTATLESCLIRAPRGSADSWLARLTLRFSQPVPEVQLHALWTKLRITDPRDATSASLGADGSYTLPHADGSPATRLHLRRLLPCEPVCQCRLDRGQRYQYAPPACARGYEIEVQASTFSEPEFCLPPHLFTPQGLGLGEDALRLRVGIMPAIPRLMGDGCNILPLHGNHCLQLPFINLGRVVARAWRWEAEEALRCIQDISEGLRDDTPTCEFLMQRDWLQAREAEGIMTEGVHEPSALEEVGAALLALGTENRLAARHRERALEAAFPYPAQELYHESAESASLVSTGELLLDMDALTGGRLRPGLHLVSLELEPGAAVCRALRSRRRAEETPAAEAAAPPFRCVVDYLVQVTDMSARCAGNRLMVNSLVTGEPLEGVLAFPESRAVSSEGAPPVLTLAGGETPLPDVPCGCQLLLRRGEDYCLTGYCNSSYLCPPAGEDSRPQLVLFCERPLYRPGDCAHVSGVLRCPTSGGLALPQAREGELCVYRPNRQLLLRERVELNAWGAFSQDVALPDGEEDVTGDYRCCVRVTEGQEEVRAELELCCQVFRRDAFTASLALELDPVAPTSFRVRVQARDYNGSPVSGGRVTLHCASSALLAVEGEGVGLPERWLHEEEPPAYSLPLDAEGCAELCGELRSDGDSAGYLRVSGSVTDARQNELLLEAVDAHFFGTECLLQVEEGSRLHLLDARTQEALAREQEVELVVRESSSVWESLPSGIRYETFCCRERLRRCLTIPAGCREGVALQPLLESLEGEQRWMVSLQTSDAVGRSVRLERTLYPSEKESALRRAFHSVMEENGELELQGSQLIFRSTEPFPQTQRLHAFISSQGKLRHALVAVQEGETQALLPASPAEYGQVVATFVLCMPDARGMYTRWQTLTAQGALPRAEKQLRVEMELPERAAPGAPFSLRGRVRDAAGRPTRAALALFAVDAGMMSVAPWKLPVLTAAFYRGQAGELLLERARQRRQLPEPQPLAMPYLRVPQPRMDWEHASYDARWRSPLPPGIMGAGRLCHQQLAYIVRASAAHGPGRYAGGLGLGWGLADWGEDDFPGSRICCSCCAEDEAGMGQGVLPRLRRHFAPLALWQASLETDAEGRFATTATLPDTLTTYRVYAVALSACGGCFGSAEGEFGVQQALMLTPGVPWFMSVGDRLRLPLTASNRSEQAGCWRVELCGAGEVPPQQLRLEGGESSTLFFEVEAAAEGECCLQWTASPVTGSDAAGDAVEERFPVRLPVPVLREAHHLVLGGEEGGGRHLELAELLAEEVGQSARGELMLECSASPLLFLAGSLHFLLDYPYGCTEQRASALLPWLFHEQLAPFCPDMAERAAGDVRRLVQEGIRGLLERQQADGGLSYWSTACGSCDWASAYAALVLSVAHQQGFAVDGGKLNALRHYLLRQHWQEADVLTRYAVARVCGSSRAAERLLREALASPDSAEAGKPWLRCGQADRENLRFLAALAEHPAGRQDAFRRWLRSQGRDARHRTSWAEGWTLLALAEYLRLEATSSMASPRSARCDIPAELSDEPMRNRTAKPEDESTFLLGGECCSAGAGATRWQWRAGKGGTLRQLAPALEAVAGRVFARLLVRAQPESAELSSLTERGLQLTRVYEVQDAEGLWQETDTFAVGDVVRVSLTCAKMAEELHYLVLEDYLPSCLEPINPEVPSQAAGLPDGGRGRWSSCFDHREYLKDRVRGFSTRWGGQRVVNLVYYARAKRAGSCVAPPAVGQLMYEPQCCGWSSTVSLRCVPPSPRPPAEPHVRAAPSEL